MNPEYWAVGVDVGGTFVDAVACSSRGSVVSVKEPRGDGSPAAGVFSAVERLLSTHGIAAHDVLRLVHGSTVVTNLLLELDALPVAVLATAGTTDVLALARQDRQDLYAPAVVPPTSEQEIFPKQLRFAIGGRMNAAGEEVEPLDEASVQRAADVLLAAGVRSVAIGLLFSHLNPSHEQRVGKLLLERDNQLHVSLSSEVDPRPREFERFFVTALDAYVKPRVSAYLHELAVGLQVRSLPQPSLMRSEGGIASWREALERPISLALSGPCAAMDGVALSLHGQQVPQVMLTMDVGGTSTDIGMIEDGKPLFGDNLQFGGLKLRLRSADIESVAVGGGSVAQVLPGGGLRLGPRSQGASPGPAAYGRGGRLATLSDALCVLRRLPATLAGALPLDFDAARQAIEHDIAQPLGIDVRDAAHAVVRTAATAMAEALKMRAFQRGLDPAHCLLVAGGGGGAQHAAEVAELAGMQQVRVLAHAGVIAALGLLGARPRRTIEKPCNVALDARGMTSLQAARMSLLPVWPYAQVQWSLALCYAGQENAIDMDWQPGQDDADAMIEKFHTRHAQLRGQSQRSQPVCVRLLRGVFEQTLPAPGLGEEPMPHAQDAWSTAFSGSANKGIQGPRAIFASATSVWIPSGWTCTAQPDNSLLLTRDVLAQGGGANA